MSQVAGNQVDVFEWNPIFVFFSPIFTWNKLKNVKDEIIFSQAKILFHR